MGSCVVVSFYVENCFSNVSFCGKGFRLRDAKGFSLLEKAGGDLGLPPVQRARSHHFEMHRNRILQEILGV